MSNHVRPCPHCNGTGEVPRYECQECNDTGWAEHPDNGWNPKARRCSRGCPSRCTICQNDDCDNPNGQH